LGRHNKKFNPNGNPKPFYGFTCIAWVGQESRLFQELCNLQNIFRKEFQNTGLGNVFSFLKPESFHMTICDINASPNPGRCLDRKIVKSVEDAFHRIWIQEIQGKVISLIRGIGLQTTIAALVRFDSESELQKVYSIEREIKESTGVNVRDFAGHISLAYFVQHPGDKIDTVKDILLPYEETILDEFTFSQFDLTYFTDMNTYFPILTFNLENGKVTDHDSNLKNISRLTRVSHPKKPANKPLAHELESSAVIEDSEPDK